MLTAKKSGFATSRLPADEQIVTQQMSPMGAWPFVFFSVGWDAGRSRQRDQSTCIFRCSKRENEKTPAQKESA